MRSFGPCPRRRCWFPCVPDRGFTVAWACSTVACNVAASLARTGRTALLDLDREILLGNGNKMGALKVTLQQFYLPDGESTQREGVKADVILPSLSTHMDIGEADLQYALPSDRWLAYVKQQLAGA